MKLATTHTTRMTAIRTSSAGVMPRRKLAS